MTKTFYKTKNDTVVIKTTRNRKIVNTSDGNVIVFKKSQYEALKEFEYLLIANDYVEKD